MGRFIGARGKLLPHGWIKPTKHYTGPHCYHGGGNGEITPDEKESAAVLVNKINESLTRRVKGFLAGMFTKKNFMRRKTS